MTELCVAVPQPPSQNQTLRIGRAGKLYRTRAAKDFKETVAVLCREAKFKPFDCDVEVKLFWHRKVARGDCDNAMKHLLDSLQGFAYHNDSQVKIIRMEVFDDKPPHAYIAVMVKKVERGR